MTCVLGYPLDDAVRRLSEEGFDVRTQEVRSRKGLDGGENRVVRQKVNDANILLTYAAFQTELNSSN